LNYPGAQVNPLEIARRALAALSNYEKRRLCFFSGEIYYLFSPLADIRRPVDSEAIHTP
jgi:hypothetical protein